MGQRSDSAPPNERRLGLRNLGRRHTRRLEFAPIRRFRMGGRVGTGSIFILVVDPRLSRKLGPSLPDWTDGIEYLAVGSAPDRIAPELRLVVAPTKLLDKRVEDCGHQDGVGVVTAHGRVERI